LECFNSLSKGDIVLTVVILTCYVKCESKVQAKHLQIILIGMLLQQVIISTGDYSHGTTYKTGDVVRYGGNSYVAIANHTNEYPANTDGTTNSTYWELVVKGFNYHFRSTYDAATTYNIGDVVRYISSTYVMLKDRQCQMLLQVQTVQFGS
jgi:hypothetical protein